MPGRASAPISTMLSAVLLAALLAQPASAASAQPLASSPASDPERAAALAAVSRYFEAADSGSADAVRSAFWPTGRVEGVGGGRFLSWTADDFATLHFRGQPNTRTDIARAVEWLDVSGTGAVARVKVSIGANSTYWDYFVLHKLGGEWKIGLKAFANPVSPSQ